MAPSTRRVTKDWVRSYDPALAVQAGDVVAVAAEDHEWPGWWWCVDGAGQGGWLPTDLLETTASGPARVLRAMDTRELTVSAGETVQIFRSERGWTMCQNAQGDRGWVPDAHLGPA